MKNTCAVILAAGVGSRMGAPVTKQKIEILGKTVLRRTLEAFEACESIGSIVIVTRADEMEFARAQASGITKLYNVTVGGNTRAESAACGFSVIPKDTDYVAIHDAARCLVTAEMISKVVLDAEMYGAATAATRVTDTVKIVDKDGFVSSTPDRNYVMLASTPQVFSTIIYNKALSGVDLSDSKITDDNMLVERIGVKVFCTDVGKRNIKITTKSDIAYANLLLKGECDE